MFVTAHTEDQHRLIGELVDALALLRVDVRADDDVIVVDGNRIVAHVLTRAHPTPADLRQVIADSPPRVPSIVVADRISSAGRDVLRDAGWSWLDRRGHLRFWAPGVRIESPLPDAAGRAGRPTPTNAWTTVGLEIALASLCSPHEPVTARRVAAAIGRSVGATHELIGRFEEIGLVGRKTHAPLLPELFWETSAQWPDDSWVQLDVSLEAIAERVGPEEVVRVDERAATLGGARIAAVGDLPARCYLRSAASLRRARALGGNGDGTHRSLVRASPVDWLPVNEAHPPDADHPWQVAHPLVCALRLATDPARGREIVDAWGIVPTAP